MNHSQLHSPNKLYIKFFVQVIVGMDKAQKARAVQAAGNGPAKQALVKT